MKKQFILSLFSFLLAAFSAFAQENPVKWDITSKPLGGDLFEITYSAKIQSGWYVYSEYLESEDGPIPTAVTFESKNQQVQGKSVEDGHKVSGFDEMFAMNITKFKDVFTIKQKIKVTDGSQPVKGYLTYMTCNNEKCLPPRDVEFSFSLKPGTATSPNGTGQVEPIKVQGNVPTSPTTTTTPNGVAQPQDNTTATAGTTDPQTNNQPNAVAPATLDLRRPNLDIANPVGNCMKEEQKEDKGLWLIFLAGFLGGFVALLTPCVFPMLPLTVSFFTKRSKTKAEGIKNAFLYGGSIIAIYVGLGLLITTLLGETALNELSTNWIANVAFFLIFFVFALSFFGFFEITLPSSWTNATNSKAGQGGILGIFFMAATLGLVSFSCTGPIIGTLLVEASRSSILGPAVGMFGFSLALALPFGLFAAFPGWLQSLPKSGGWMNTVKVVLGFVEVALAFKFLSVADLTMHWGILKYETFMAIWILCALGLALYFFGILKMPVDHGFAPPRTPSRLAMGALSVALAIYLGFGFQVNKERGVYDSLNLTSGVAPPVGYSIFHPSPCPYGMRCYKDYYEGLAVAKAEGKPLFVDFTGHGCVNCRRMEDFVWSKPEVFKYLNEKYVVVSLYVDDRTKLETPAIAPDGSKLRTVGARWASFEVQNIKQISQPYYLLLSPDEKVLNNPVGYTPDVQEYAAFLQCGLDNNEKLKAGK